MARSRNIKPGFFQNEDLAECNVYARLLFIGMWTLADRMGRLEDRPRKIKYQLMPTDEFDPEAAVAELAERGFLLRYQVGDGHYLQVVNWDKHQSPHIKEQASTLPAPDMHQTCTVQTPEQHPLDSLIPGSLDTVEDSVSHETGADAPSPVSLTRKRTKPKSDKPPQDNRCWPLWESACELVDVDAAKHPGKGKQMGVIDTLLRNYDPPDLLGCFRWLLVDSWERQRGVDFVRVGQRIDAYISAGRPDPGGHSNGQLTDDDMTMLTGGVVYHG